MELANSPSVALQTVVAVVSHRLFLKQQSYSLFFVCSWPVLSIRVSMGSVKRAVKFNEIKFTELDAGAEILK